MKCLPIEVAVCQVPGHWEGELSQFSQGYLNSNADQLNNRPRRCLNYETPFKVYFREISNLQHGVALQN
jgi:hypothetical protein